MAGGPLSDSTLIKAADLAARKTVLASYVVYKDGATYRVENLKGGSDPASSTDGAVAVENAAVQASPGDVISGKGEILTLFTTLNLPNKKLTLRNFKFDLASALAPIIETGNLNADRGTRIEDIEIDASLQNAGVAINQPFQGDGQLGFVNPHLVLSNVIVRGGTNTASHAIRLRRPTNLYDCIVTDRAITTTPGTVAGYKTEAQQIHFYNCHAQFCDVGIWTAGALVQLVGGFLENNQIGYKGVGDYAIISSVRLGNNTVNAMEILNEEHAIIGCDMFGGTGVLINPAFANSPGIILFGCKFSGAPLTIQPNAFGTYIDGCLFEAGSAIVDNGNRTIWGRGNMFSLFDLDILPFLPITSETFINQVPTGMDTPGVSYVEVNAGYRKPVNFYGYRQARIFVAQGSGTASAGSRGVSITKADGTVIAQVTWVGTLVLDRTGAWTDLPATNLALQTCQLRHKGADAVDVLTYGSVHFQAR